MTTLSRIGTAYCAAAAIFGGTLPRARPTIHGTWSVHIEHMSGRVVDEQWVVDQHGKRMRGTVKTARQEFVLEGTVDGNMFVVRVSVTSNRFNVFRGRLTGDTIEGSIEQTGGDNGTFSGTRVAQ